MNGNPNARTDALLAEIRDLLAHRGTGKRGMLTENLGVETPLVMADITSEASKDLVGAGPDFVGLGTFDCHHYIGGVVEVTIGSRKPAAIVSYGAEVQVVGIIMGTRDILGTGFANSNTGPFRVVLPINTAYDQITVQARQVVNGVPTNDNPQTNNNLVGASLQGSYAVRVYR